MNDIVKPCIPKHIHNSYIANDAPPLTPKTRRSMNFASENASNVQLESKDISSKPNNSLQQKPPETLTKSPYNIKQVLMSAPCPCTSLAANYENVDTNTNTQATKFIGPYANYDMPKAPIQQVMK